MLRCDGEVGCAIIHLRDTVAMILGHLFVFVSSDLFVLMVYIDVCSWHVYSSDVNTDEVLYCHICIDLTEMKAVCVQE